MIARGMTASVKVAAVFSIAATAELAVVPIQTKKL